MSRQPKRKVESQPPPHPPFRGGIMFTPDGFAAAYKALNRRDARRALRILKQLEADRAAEPMYIHLPSDTAECDSKDATK